MKKETRSAVRGGAPGLEACRFEGLTRTFPSHCHGYYVVGLVEAGRRVMTCGGRQYLLSPGSAVLFAPGDSHGCISADGEPFSYRSLHLSRELVLNWSEALSGRREPPRLLSGALSDKDLAGRIRSLHEAVMSGSPGTGELNCLLSALIPRYGRLREPSPPRYGPELARACAFLEENYCRRVTLDQLCRCAGLSKSTLLRAFTRWKGITPYRYLEALRVNAAGELLRQGVSPLEAALRTGFSDQSHFTNYFTRFIGLAPGAYRSAAAPARERTEEACHAEGKMRHGDRQPAPGGADRQHCRHPGDHPGAAAARDGGGGCL